MAGNTLSRHHIVPRSKWGTWEKDNIKRLKVKTHEALHILFSNDTPQEQIQRLIQLNYTALTREFVSDITRILEINDDEYFYKNGVLVPKWGDF